MKNGRKYLAFFAVLALCAMTLCGCHGSGTTEQFTVPSSFDESREYEIAFWAKNDTNKVQIEIYKKAIEDGSTTVWSADEKKLVPVAKVAQEDLNRVCVKMQQEQ